MVLLVLVHVWAMTADYETTDQIQTVFQLAAHYQAQVTMGVLLFQIGR